jgi:hypothetical protein
MLTATLFLLPAVVQKEIVCGVVAGFVGGFFVGLARHLLGI